MGFLSGIFNFGSEGSPFDPDSLDRLFDPTQWISPEAAGIAGLVGLNIINDLFGSDAVMDFIRDYGMPGSGAMAFPPGVIEFPPFDIPIPIPTEPMEWPPEIITQYQDYYENLYMFT